MSDFELGKALLFLEENVRDLRDALTDLTPDDIARHDRQLRWMRSIAEELLTAWAAANAMRGGVR